MKKQAEQIDLTDLRIPEFSQKALYLEWRVLEIATVRLLYRLLERDATVYIDGSEYLWNFVLCWKKPMSNKKMVNFLTMIDSEYSDEPEKSIDHKGNPTWKLDADMSLKLISLILPPFVKDSHADNDGVWFTSGPSVAKKSTYEKYKYELRNDYKSR